MTNREWLFNKMQNMSVEELAEFFDVKNILCEMIDTNCRDNGGNCEKCIANWLKAEHKEKPKLSNVERVILENIDEYFEMKWICRDKDGTVYLYVVKPEKAEKTWQKGGLGMSMSLFSHLFQFITWEDEQAYNIEELLKNENRN